MGVMKKLSQQMLSSRSRSNPKINNIPFEISLESVSESDKFARRQDKERVKQFNEDIAAWSIHAASRLKQNVRSIVKDDRHLSNSINPRIYFDNKYTKEANKIGFSFVREGIYVHKGAGRGQGGYKGGSSWYNAKGVRKETLSESLMKMGTGNRKAQEWFDPIIKDELPQLADLIANYSATLQIDATSIFID